MPSMPSRPGVVRPCLAAEAVPGGIAHRRRTNRADASGPSPARPTLPGTRRTRSPSGSAPSRDRRGQSAQVCTDSTGAVSARLAPVVHSAAPGDDLLRRWLMSRQCRGSGGANEDPIPKVPPEPPCWAVSGSNIAADPDATEGRLRGRCQITRMVRRPERRGHTHKSVTCGPWPEESSRSE
jgi:hypothetical protein